MAKNRARKIAAQNQGKFSFKEIIDICDLWGPWAVAPGEFEEEIHEKRKTALFQELIPHYIELVDYFSGGKPEKDLSQINDALTISNHERQKQLKRRATINKKLKFHLSDEMKKDLKLLLEAGVLNRVENNVPDFKNAFHAIAVFEIWTEKKFIPKIKGRRNKIISQNVLVAGKQHDFKNERRRYSSAYEKEILAILPHYSGS